MSKKKSGLLIAFGAMLGGAVITESVFSISGVNDELDQDFHEYEEEETPSEETEEKTEPAPERTYITINPGKDADAAVDSVKAETEDSKEAECPEEKTSSVVVEDDTEEGKTE